MGNRPPRLLAPSRGGEGRVTAAAPVWLRVGGAVGARGVYYEGPSLGVGTFGTVRAVCTQADPGGHPIVLVLKQPHGAPASAPASAHEDVWGAALRDMSVGTSVLHPNVMPAVTALWGAPGTPPSLLFPLYRPLPPPTASVNHVVSLVVEVARGVVDGMHRYGWVHQDVKPDNVVLNPGVPCAVVTDFGTSRPWVPALGGTTITQTTPGVAAPETWNPAPYDPAAADLWSIGMTAVALMYGAPTLDAWYAAFPLDLAARADTRLGKAFEAWVLSTLRPRPGGRGAVPRVQWNAARTAWEFPGIYRARRGKGKKRKNRDGKLTVTWENDDARGIAMWFVGMFRLASSLGPHVDVMDFLDPGERTMGLDAWLRDARFQGVPLPFPPAFTAGVAALLCPNPRVRSAAPLLDVYAPDGAPAACAPLPGATTRCDAPSVAYTSRVNLVAVRHPWDELTLDIPWASASVDPAFLAQRTAAFRAILHMATLPGRRARGGPPLQEVQGAVLGDTRLRLPWAIEGACPGDVHAFLILWAWGWDAVASILGRAAYDTVAVPWAVAHVVALVLTGRPVHRTVDAVGHMAWGAGPEEEQTIQRHVVDALRGRLLPLPLHPAVRAASAMTFREESFETFAWLSVMVTINESAEGRVPSMYGNAPRAGEQLQALVRAARATPEVAAQVHAAVHAAGHLRPSLGVRREAEEEPGNGTPATDPLAPSPWTEEA